VNHLLRSELHEPLGLASPNVQVLDPCCGAGAYLVEVLHCIERTLKERAGDDDAFVASDLRCAATTRIFGFEIMPAPFVIAHLQIASLLEDAGSSLTADQRAQVFLTNALTGWVPARHPQSNFGFPAFIEERDAAEAVKQSDTILVILGNPPYNGYAGIAVGEERDLSDAYRAVVEGLPSPQGQGLNELYVRFFVSFR
jgi:predicted helicase